MTTVLSSVQHARLRQLLDIFLESNKRLNLSAYRTEEHCWAGNILDSLALVDLLPRLLGDNWPQLPVRILDVGTGGGFPLLPLAIAMPSARFVGLDAVRKKADAVEAMARTLQLANVEILCARSEEAAHRSELRASFDLVLSRAVAPLNVLLEYTMPFLKVHGRAVLWKSLHIDRELTASAKARSALSAHVTAMERYQLPAGFGERQLLIFEQQHPTPEQYPRKTGIPKKRPL